MTILIAILISTINLLCFYFGYKVGFKTNNKEEINLDRINPVKVIRNIEQNIESSKEQERMRIIAENIDAYDGTGLGQKDIP